MFSSIDKQYIVHLAQEAIEHFLDTGEKLAIAPSPLESPSGRGTGEVPRTLLDKGACFVTLTKDFELRGCIGSLEAIKPLYLDIIDNATSAALEDDRFFPVTKKELPEIQIEVSVLTKPMLLSVAVGAGFPRPRVGAIHKLPQQSHQGGETPPLPANKILDALTIGVDGVIIKRENKSATYLPQVWDEILDKHDFMSSLCLKAGLEPDDWYKPGTQIWTYKVEIIN